MAQTTLLAERSNIAAKGSVPGLVSVSSGSTAGNLDRIVGDVMDAAERECRSPIRWSALPASMMIDLARRGGRVDDPVVRQQLARYHTHIAGQPVDQPPDRNGEGASDRCGRAA